MNFSLITLANTAAATPVPDESFYWFMSAVAQSFAALMAISIGSLAYFFSTYSGKISSYKTIIENRIAFLKTALTTHSSNNASGFSQYKLNDYIQRYESVEGLLRMNDRERRAFIFFPVLNIFMTFVRKLSEERFKSKIVPQEIRDRISYFSQILPPYEESNEQWSDNACITLSYVSEDLFRDSGDFYQLFCRLQGDIDAVTGEIGELPEWYYLGGIISMFKGELFDLRFWIMLEVLTYCEIIDISKQERKEISRDARVFFVSSLIPFMSSLLMITINNAAQISALDSYKWILATGVPPLIFLAKIILRITSESEG